MSRMNIEPLESYRLGRYALPIPCLLCGHDNLFDADACRHCSAPMALGRSALRHKKPTSPQVLATLGPDGAGKSVFLGVLLDILSRQRERLDFTTCDASSVALQQEAIAALARGEFPDATSTEEGQWRWAHCQLHRRSQKMPLDVFMADISGKSLIREMDQPQTYPLLSGLAQKATGIMLCIDSNQATSGDKDEEFFAMQILNHVGDMRRREADGGGKKKDKRKQPKMPPLAILLTKADLQESCFRAPGEFVRRQMPNLWEQCQELDCELDFFGVAVVGACATRRSESGHQAKVPLRIEPRGVIEPFRWLMGHMTN